jgi:hypothetical protein
MKHNKLFDVIGTVLLGGGFFFALLPHATHVAAGFASETSHLTHIIIGTILIVVSLGVLIYNNKALKIWK